MVAKQTLQIAKSVTEVDSVPIKTDAQPNRSRQWMLDALIALMREKPFSQITISEIAARSQLDRRTFYRHFKTKEDVIVHRIRQLSKHFEPFLHRQEPLRTEEIALHFFRICEANKDLLLLLYANKLMPLLLYELNTIFPEHHNYYHGSAGIYGPYDEDYALAYHVGGFWNTLLRWIGDGMEKTPEELAKTVASFLPEQI